MLDAPWPVCQRDGMDGDRDSTARTDGGAAPDDDWLVRADADPGGIAGHYDTWADDYDADLARWSYQAPRVAAAGVLAQSPPTSVLDVGCGTGLVGAALREAGYRGRLVGIDISESSLQRARARGAYDDVRAADLTQPLDFGDDAFAALACVGVMTYLPDVEGTWREFARVTEPGGRLVVTQREDFWEPRDCQAVIDRLEDEGVWSAVEVRGPAPYLPEADGALADLGCYYVTLQVV